MDRSINQIARDLNIPESTTRRYFEAYKEYLRGTRYGSVVKYPDEALLIVKQIYESHKKGISTEEIRQSLKGTYTRVIDADPVEAETGELQLVNITQQQFMKSIADYNAVMLQAVQTNNETLKLIANQAEEIRALREEIRLMKEQQETQPAAASFWDRFRGKK